MVDHAIDGSGQIAIATYRGTRWSEDEPESLPLRDVRFVLVKLCNMKKQGMGTTFLCTACAERSSLKTIEPEGEQLYRTAKIENR